jgi:lysophospholipase L1-like esterase
MRTLFFVSPLAALPCLLYAEPAKLAIVGDWQVRLEAGPISVAERQATLTAPATLEVAPSTIREVTDEAYDQLPVFNPAAGGWVRGTQLRGVKCQECTARFLLDPQSFHLKKDTGAAAEWRRGVDYEVDLEWGTFGRLEGGTMTPESKAYADYRHGLARLDTIVVTAAGQVLIKPGTPDVAIPKPPAAAAGELPVCTIYTTARQAKLTPAALFPILELAYPEAPVESPTPAERLLPKTLAKLRSGAKVRVLAWGDSVTQAGYLPHPDNRWQVQFVTRLKERFPKADIELIHLGWGGRNTSSFLAEPPGSEFNYQERVLGAKADLVVSEFVNDSGMNPAQTKERYGKLLADFQAQGAEWIILTPHYVRPDWMGLQSERDCDDDPRPYVQALRVFAAENPVALADASKRYGRLWRLGIPYNCLMMNAINHPDPVGMKLFADAIMVLFPAR